MWSTTKGEIGLVHFTGRGEHSTQETGLGRGVGNLRRNGEGGLHTGECRDLLAGKELPEALRGIKKRVGTISLKPA